MQTIECGFPKSSIMIVCPLLLILYINDLPNASKLTDPLLSLMTPVSIILFQAQIAQNPYLMMNSKILMFGGNVISFQLI